MALVKLKRGDTFAFTADFADAADIPMTGITDRLRSQIRDSNNKLIAEMTVTETDTPGQTYKLRFYVYLDNKSMGFYNDPWIWEAIFYWKHSSSSTWVQGGRAVADDYGIAIPYDQFIDICEISPTQIGIPQSIDIKIVGNRYSNHSYIRATVYCEVHYGASTVEDQNSQIAYIAMESS